MTKLVMANASAQIIKPMQAYRMVSFALFVLLGSPAAVMYCTPPTTMNATATTPRTPMTVFIILMMTLDSSAFCWHPAAFLTASGMLVSLQSISAANEDGGRRIVYNAGKSTIAVALKMVDVFFIVMLLCYCLIIIDC